MSNIVFITGTDTGAGKTVLTALLLAVMRRRGLRARALKPFCAGDREDARILRRMQDGPWGLEVINPVHFPEAAAPWVGARKSGRRIGVAASVRHIQACARKCPLLLVEGVGGVMVPLSRQHTMLDLIRELGCPVLIAARNRLGVLNHALLTVHALRTAGVADWSVVLMETGQSGVAERTNYEILRSLLGKRRVWTVPFMNSNPLDASHLQRSIKLFQKSLAARAQISRLSHRHPATGGVTPDRWGCKKTKKKF